MNTSKLTLAHALAIMENKEETFTLSFWSNDTQKKTGGKLITVQNCTKAGVASADGNKGFISLVNPSNTHHPIKVRTWLIHSLNNCTVIL